MYKNLITFTLCLFTNFVFATDLEIEANRHKAFANSKLVTKDEYSREQIEEIKKELASLIFRGAIIPVFDLDNCLVNSFEVYGNLENSKLLLNKDLILSQKKLDRCSIFKFFAQSNLRLFAIATNNVAAAVELCFDDALVYGLRDTSQMLSNSEGKISAYEQPESYKRDLVIQFVSEHIASLKQNNCQIVIYFDDKERNCFSDFECNGLLCSSTQYLFSQSADSIMVQIYKNLHNKGILRGRGIVPLKYPRWALYTGEAACNDCFRFWNIADQGNDSCPNCASYNIEWSS